MIRIALAGLVAVGLAIGIWLLWPGEIAEDGSVATVMASPATPIVVSASTTTTTETTTTTVEPHVVESVEEAEAILRELWFGWFEGIYNQDEDRIREVVATEAQVQSGRDAFVENFPEPPAMQNIAFEGSLVLRSDEACLAISTTMVLNRFRTGSTDGVHILRWKENQWIRLSLWADSDDLWEADCDASL